MDYQKHYNKLIQNAIMNPYEGYTENHHIIPKCMGGDDSKSNLVKLSAKQHFVAHHLLCKIYGGSKLANAWYSMCRIGKGQEDRRVNARRFDRVKSVRSKLLSEEMTGERNPFFGKNHTKETRSKIRDKTNQLRLWETRSDAHKASLLEAQKKPKTSEHKCKIGRKGLIMLQNIVSNEIIRVDCNDPRGKSDEWVNPRKLKPEQKFKCAHCDVITTKSNLTRWHNDNCKQRKQNEN